MQMAKQAINIIFCVALLTLSACNSAEQSQSTASVLPPKYLEVKQFQDCLGSKQNDTYRQWCMPASKRDSCPSQSWEQLNKMQGKDKIPSCE